MNKWQTIETAPRDSTHIIVAYRRDDGEWRVMEAWWAIPYEAAPLEKGWWQTMGGVLLSADIHRAGAHGDGKPLGATHWMPLPDPPTASTPSPAPKEPR